MIKTISSSERHFTDMGWLKTYWLFSFSDYYDPHNANHGALRVFNDDVVQPGTGFGTHPHEEMEIVSIVLRGEMTHQDSMGNKTVIRAGDVQRMTAGTGLRHSEWNHADSEVHFFQIWIQPDQSGLSPGYDQQFFSPESYRGQLLPVASDKDIQGVVKLNTGASIYRSHLTADQNVQFDCSPGHVQFVYIVDGEATINGTHILARDQARIKNEKHLDIRTASETDLVLIEVRE